MTNQFLSQLLFWIRGVKSAEGCQVRCVTSLAAKQLIRCLHALKPTDSVTIITLLAWSFPALLHSPKNSIGIKISNHQNRIIVSRIIKLGLGFLFEVHSKHLIQPNAPKVCLHSVLGNETNNHHRNGRCAAAAAAAASPISHHRDSGSVIRRTGGHAGGRGWGRPTRTNSERRKAKHD